MSELDVDHCLGAFEVPPWNMGVERPGDISYGKYLILWYESAADL